MSLYEPGGALVAGPGKVAVGAESLRGAFEDMFASKPTVPAKSYEIIETEDIAMYFSDWNASAIGPNGSPIEFGGKSSGVLRRQPDGTWLIAIDNPQGTAILG